MSLFIKGKEINSFHFVGVLGIGMSAIAQYLAKDCQISGSDRGLCGGEDEKILENAGISLFLQDGSGVSEKTGALVVSTAIENDNPDIKKANDLNVPIYHRSDVLAAIVEKCHTVSVSGTSGKSSVSSMIFHILDFAGKKPSLVGGANLHSLRKKGMLGNAFRGEKSANEREILVIEADESDGTVVKYFPEISVFLNVSRDHKEVGEITDLLKIASLQSKLTIYNLDDKNFAGFCGKTFGFSRKADYFPQRYSCAENSCAFTIGDASAVVNFTGEHTVMNATAAWAVCSQLGVDDKTIASALQNYTGIARRFDKYPAKNGITVIDDYAHNPEKISAAITAAKMRKTPLSVVFQPHGFGPLKFMFDDLKEMFQSNIGENDRLYLLPTFYAGGTADKTLDSNSLADALNGERFVFVENREILTKNLIKTARENETILICGARDNSLSNFARELAERF